MEINNRYTFGETIKIDQSDFVVYKIVISLYGTLEYQMWNLKDNSYHSFEEWQLINIEERNKHTIGFNTEDDKKEKSETVGGEFDKSGI